MTLPLWVLPVAVVFAFLAGPVALVVVGYVVTRKLVTGRWWNR